ncbi:hypothetical protein ARMGADRAFT_1009987 [Armillaria gallica]|uniref:Extracellular membrane protein CFEM domain-containing protein n=1 Tax=Armillaria gallica TaxID=47427 RepID=A0A2H3DZM3_ARMGA|nr:hypothetical protein ARMGADRAFT_1009987 [Armillaria gallica]
MAIGSSVHIALIVIAHPMSSVFLPPRGQCTQVTDNNQLCQCLSFASTLDQHICWCGHGIHAHVDYISMFVHQCAAMNCTAYYPKTSRVQACTCSASLIEHIPVINVYRSPPPLPYTGADTLPSNAILFTGGTTNIPFIPVPMPAPSSNDNPSHSYGEILAPAPQPVIQTAVLSQVDAHSQSEVGNFYIAQHQNDNSSVINNVQDSSANFREDHLTTYNSVHGVEAWAGHH